MAITQQALWGRAMDYWKEHGHISYRRVIQEGLEKEGIKAFFTVPKWFSRVLMNAPAQGTLPWFYNEVLPIGETTFLQSFQSVFTAITGRPSDPIKMPPQRPHYATLPTANPEFTHASIDSSSGKFPPESTQVR